MSKPQKEEKKPFFFLKSAVKEKKEEAEETAKPIPPDPKPSLNTIGLTDCSVCRAECSVVLTRSGHPFTACGKCGARTFYNSHIAIQFLKHHTRELKNE